MKPSLRIKNQFFIEPKLYRLILKSMPIICVDLVIYKGKEFLLNRRINYPAKNEWWLIGGRILKDEKVSQTIKRKVMEEAKVKGLKNIEFLGFAETFFKKNMFGDKSHTINLVFKAETLSKNTVSIGADGKLRWFKKINKNWPAYVREFLRKAKFS
jgi:colanic acid biosynthesis protein WcaH